MIAYLKGKIIVVEKESIIVDVANIGYRVFVSNVIDFQIKKEYELYIHHHVREDSQVLFGFLNYDEYCFFQRLIEVKGIGPKTAIHFFKENKVEDIQQAIMEGNLKYLQQLKGIGKKGASQMILDLKDKVVVQEVNTTNSALLEALNGLESLGYQEKDLQYVKNALKDTNYKTDQYLKMGLKLLMDKKGV